MKIKHRAYQGEDDNQRIRNLLSQNYAATHHPYYTADPPNWERISTAFHLSTTNQTIQLWEIVEQERPLLVGMVLYQHHQATFSSLTHPHYRELETMLVEWVESQYQTTKTEIKKPLKCSVCERNETQKTILAQRGYTQSELGTIFRHQHLEGTAVKAVLPPGYSLREVQTLSAALFTERAAAENDIFGGPISTKFLQALQQTPIYRPALDLVIIAPGERIAAFCTIWFDAHHHVGFYEPIGTISAYRRSGLGKALMVEGFRRLQKMGATIAYLGHSAANRGGIQLYESVGMSVFDQEYWWHKEI